MTRGTKIAILIGVAALVGLAFALKRNPAPSAGNAPTDGTPSVPTVLSSKRRVPRLVDLGATQCVPCKMMAPILEELKTEYAGRLQVDFYDVWKDGRYAEEFHIRLIPTQVFLSPDGTELFRHEGFFSKQDILGTWRRLGYDFHEAK